MCIRFAPRADFGRGFAVLLFASSLVGCDEESAADAGTDAGAPAVDAGPPRDWPMGDVPLGDEPEPGITRELIFVDGATPPANPVTGDATPAELNRTPVRRYRPTGAASLRASVVAMPGFLGGAGSFDPLARHLVRRSVEAGMPIEVLVIDRRANLLEDRRGADAAEAAQDARIARGYYFDGETVGGEAFEGFLAQGDVPFLSEWGLAVHLEDLRRVIAEASPTPREDVFLLGHSLGASIGEAFAAWRFEDGVRGTELIAGLILVDGAAPTEGIDEAQYADGIEGGVAPVPGVDGIRAGTRFAALPLLGVAVYARAEIAAMDALWAPDEVAEDPGREQVLATLLGLAPARVPAMTHRAAFGWAFDDASNGLSFAAVGMGQPAGGPTEPYDSVFGTTLVRPSDPGATYTWVDALDAEPPELTPVANLAHMWVDGPTNFAEWYFPLRLSLDVQAVGGLALAEDGWQAAAGLRAFDGALVDAPILAVAAVLAPPERYAPIVDRVAPVGADRPNAGAPRTDPEGFAIVDATDMTHIDPLSGADVPSNPVPGAVLDFVYANAAP